MCQMVERRREILGDGIGRYDCDDLAVRQASQCRRLYETLL